MSVSLRLAHLTTGEIEKNIKYLPSSTLCDYVNTASDSGIKFHSGQSLLLVYDVAGIGFLGKFDKMEKCCSRFMTGRISGKTLWVNGCAMRTEENGNHVGKCKDIDISFAYMDYVLPREEYIQAYRDAIQWSIPAVFRNIKTSELCEGFICVPTLLQILAKFDSVHWDKFSERFYEKFDGDIEKLERDMFKCSV